MLGRSADVVAAAASTVVGVVAAAAIANLVAVAAGGQAIATLGFVAVESSSVMTTIVEEAGSGFLGPRGGPSIANLAPT